MRRWSGPGAPVSRTNASPIVSSALFSVFRYSWNHSSTLTVFIVYRDTRLRVKSFGLRSPPENRASLRSARMLVPDSLLDDFYFFIGQPVQVVDDFVNQVVGALYLLVEFLGSLDCLYVTAPARRLNTPIFLKHSNSGSQDFFENFFNPVFDLRGLENSNRLFPLFTEVFRFGFPDILHHQHAVPTAPMKVALGTEDELGVLLQEYQVLQRLFDSLPDGLLPARVFYLRD